MKFTSALLTTAATALFVSFAAYAEETKPAETPAPAAEKAPEKAVPAPAKAAADYTILTINGQPVKNSEVREMWSGLFPGAQAPDFETFDENVRQNVLRGVASERLLYGEATKAEFDKNPDVIKRLEAVKRQLIMQAFMEEKAKTLVSDKELKKAYDAKVAELKGKEEVHAKHILVKTEEEAKEVASQLKKGGDFDKIAKEKSIDKASGAQGGDLGYFTKERMVPAFSEAAFKMKKGETSAPVKTDFGWHIIQVEDRRPAQTPSFDDMKESLRAELQNKAMQNYVENMFKAANIKYFDAQGKEKPLPKEFAQPKAPDAAAGAEAKPAAGATPQQ